MIREKIFNINVHNIALNEFLKVFHKGILFTPNVDHIINLQNDLEFYNAYKKADYLVCDSQVMKIFFFLTRLRKLNKITGSDFFPAFCKYHQNNPDIKIFLLGSGPGVAIKAMDRINKKYSRKIIVGAHSPSFGFEKNEKECLKIVRDINKTEATVLLVGVGSPKQEKWIAKHYLSFNKIKFFLALGATIDFESGVVKRSPKWISTLALEWLYRLIQEPKRMYRRYLLRNPYFFILLLRDFFNRYKNPFS